MAKRKEPIDVIISPFQAFVKAESSGGLVLLFTAICALVWANSPFSASYHHFFELPLSLGFGSKIVTKPLHFWINDGLMAIFFFVIGLEIKRELVTGQLASIKAASLPLFAAVGGMLVPALIFIAFNPQDFKGFGIPMATDIAFAVGIIAMLGDRVSTTSKVFLTALAIIDDIGAALVIAVFYSNQLNWIYLGAGLVLFSLMVVLNRLGVRHIIPYSILGFGVWLGFLWSGIHPTLSGILAAFSIPARTRIDAAEFLDTGKSALKAFEAYGKTGKGVVTSKVQKGALVAINKACDLAEAPLEKLEHLIHPWVVFLIMPIFALANAGVTLGDFDLSIITHPTVLGIILGLFIGKQLGVFGFSWVAVKLGLAERNAELSWKEIYGVGCLAGIGFTMSIFISSLAYESGTALETAKLAVFIGSILSGALGWGVLKIRCKVSDSL